MKKRTSFIKFIKFWAIIFPIVMGISIIAVDFINSYHYLNFHADQMRVDYTVRHKQVLKQEVERVVDMIRYEKAQSEKLTKSKIKSRVYEAHSIVHHIYQENKTTKNKVEIQKMILDAISSIRFEQGNGYYFISRFDGKALLFPSKPELEEKNLINVRDMRGKFITKDIIQIVKQSGEGFHQYHWTKPNAEGKNYKKISFIKQLEIYDWCIGTGLYVADIEDKIKKDLLSTISRIRFGKEGYIFINRLNGDALVSNGEVFSVTKKLWEVFNKKSEKIKDIFEKEYNAALKPAGDYIYYSWEKLTDSSIESPKVSFIYGVPDLNWLVGAGIYLDDIENDIAMMKTELINQTKQKIFYFILIVVGISTIIILFFNWMNRRFKKDIQLFISFFNRAAYSDKKIDRTTIKFIELDRMAGYANKMQSDRKKVEEINQVLLAISNAMNTTRNLDDLFRFIHNSFKTIFDVTNFFIAMVDIKNRTLHFPYYVDTKDVDISPFTNFDKNDSLTGLVVFQRRPVLLKKKELEKRASQNGIWGAVPLVWMGAPLIVKDEVIGVVAVQSYLDENLYSEEDLHVLSMISDHMSIAIDRKRAEDALRESERQYRHLFNNAPAGIYEIDFEKIRFINVNEVMCKYSGYSEEELLSMNPLDLLTKESRNLFVKSLEQFPTGENYIDTIEYDIIKKDGQELCVILNNDFIYKNEKLTGSRVVVHDITELKKAEKEKIDAQKIAEEQKKLALVGQVAGKMAHDFNNVLGIIMGNTELSILDCKDEETKKTLELIVEQTIRGKNLTRNLVAFAKDQEPKQEFFRISEKIDLVLNLLKMDLKDIELIKDDKPGVPDLLADAGMIEHALINLIQNSIHATSLSDHPRIIIKTYCLNNKICFEIEDNGCGIPKENLGNIYEPSFTLKGTKDKTSSYGREIKGTGYGMANVKKYIGQHKGSISVESKFGSGTKFIISLPFIKKELTDEEKLEIQKEKICFDKTILLVEDEPAISGVQYRILSQEPCNHKVDIANDGQAALDLFKRNNYDLVSLDYVLPGKTNGMAVYNQIRVTDKTIPILFISGNIEFLESIKELKQKDANIDHLSKPCQNKNYVNSINKLLKRALF